MLSWVWTLIYVGIASFLAYKAYGFLKSWVANRRSNRQGKGENAFKGLVRGQRFSRNFWDMVRAYRERAIKKLGWNEE